MAAGQQPDLFGSPQSSGPGGGLDFSVPGPLRPCLRLGTCSWKYDSWKGLAYDAGKTYRPEDYLADYARHLGTVEVDQWFWSLFPSGITLPSSDSPQPRAARRPRTPHAVRTGPFP